MLLLIYIFLRQVPLLLLLNHIFLLLLLLNDLLLQTLLKGRLLLQYLLLHDFILIWQILLLLLLLLLLHNLLYRFFHALLLLQNFLLHLLLIIVIFFTRLIRLVAGLLRIFFQDLVSEPPKPLEEGVEKLVLVDQVEQFVDTCAMLRHPGMANNVDKSWYERLLDHIVPLPNHGLLRGRVVPLDHHVGEPTEPGEERVQDLLLVHEVKQVVHVVAGSMFDHPRVSYDVDESWNERLLDHIVPLPHYRPPVEKGKDKKEKESHSQTVCNSPH